MNLFAKKCPVRKFTAMYIAQALNTIASVRASSRQRDVPRGRAENSKCKGRMGVLIRASAQSTEAVLAKIRGCVVLYGELVPLYGSAGLYLDCLKLIRQLTTSTQRDQLLELPAAGIRRIWRLSKGYYDASDQDRLVAAGQWFVEDDFTSQHENEEVVGRIDSRLSLPGRLLYPRYFHSEIGPGQMVPATGEQASAVLWGSIDKQSRPDALQQSDMWPIPGKASWPHSAPWAEFLRPVAPGVYCSCTWVHPNDMSRARCVSHAILVKSDSQ